MKPIMQITVLTALLLLAGVLPLGAAFAEDLTEPVDQFCANGDTEDLVQDDGSYGDSMTIYQYLTAVTCIEPTEYPSFLTEVSGMVSNYSGASAVMVVFVDENGNGPDGNAPFWASPPFVPDHEVMMSADLTAYLEFDTPITQGAWCIGFRSISGSLYMLLDTGQPRYQDTYIGTAMFGWSNASSWGAPGNAAFRGVSESCPSQCACYIDDQCFAANDVNPANDCQQCRPMHSISGWAPRHGATCDDGIWCNGADSCQGDSCSQHTGVPCGDDGEFCNGVEICDEATDSCLSSGSPCADDGQFCNGDETCDESNDSCNSAGNPCTDDGQFCNGTESCNENQDICAHTGNPCPVDDGQFCNGNETAQCLEQSDECAHAGDPCAPGESCFEQTDECIDDTPTDDDDDSDDDDSGDDDSGDDDSGDDDLDDDDFSDDDSTDDDDFGDRDDTGGGMTAEDFGVGGNGCCGS